MTTTPIHHRPTEIAELKRLLLAGTSILMLAPRRVGKTWLMKRLADDLKADNRICVYFDAEGLGDESEFLRGLCRELERNREILGTLLDNLTQRFRQLTGGSGDSLSEIVGKLDPKTFSETLVESLSRQERPVFILIDEFSLFVLTLASRDVEATRALLYHLRKLQQQYRNVIWFLTGSVGLDVVARRFDLGGALLEFLPYALEPFSAEEALSYLTDLSDQGHFPERLAFDGAAFDYLVRELGWLAPYYLMQIGRCSRAAAPPDGQGRKRLTEAEVAQGFEKLLSPTHRLHFAPWEEHVRKNFTAEDSRHLTRILNICCAAPDGEIEDTLLAKSAAAFPDMTKRLLKNLLTSLDNDGYLTKTDGRWHFRSGLLRRYWLEYIQE